MVQPTQHVEQPQCTNNNIFGINMPVPAVPVQTYYAFLAGAVTYIAMLPCPTQLQLLRLLERQETNTRKKVPQHIFLGAAVAILWMLLHSVSLRLRHQRHPTSKPVTLTPRDIKSELTPSDKAYVHLFVENIILKAINAQLDARFEAAQRNFHGMVRLATNKNSKINKLETQIKELTRRITLAIREYKGLMTGIAELDRDISLLEKLNAMYKRDVASLQGQSLNNHKKITALTANLAAMKASRNSYRGLLNHV